MVAVPQDCVRTNLVFNFADTSGPTPEIAVITHNFQRVHVDGNITDWPADTQVVASAVRDKWKAHILPEHFSLGLTANRVDAYHLDAATGRALDKGTAAFSGASAWQGSGSYGLPAEVSLCVSLHAYADGDFVPNARTRRGRFYLPLLVGTLANGLLGTVSQTNRTALVGAVSDYLNDINGLLVDGSIPLTSDSFNLGILHRPSKNAPEPAFNRVQGGYIDSLFDVQRRRQNKLTGQRTSFVVTDS